ncbi:putative chaperone [Shigella flexneri 1235-66]|nr:putative chaperone [Shigella flexneri 1235-66]
MIYGTRVIYPAEKNEVLVQLMNQGGQSSLVQSWIDDGDSSLPPEKLTYPLCLHLRLQRWPETQASS